MNRFLLTVILLLGLFVSSQFNFTVKESGFFAGQVLPFYQQQVEPGLQSLFAALGLSISDDASEGLELLNGEPVGSESARVSRVIDGDTIDVLIGGEVKRVRYIGINTPEREEPCFDESTRANSRLVAGKRVALVRDASDQDQYGRLLRYVYVGDTLVERALLSGGYAEAVLYNQDDRHFEEFSRLEQAAAAAGLGCHLTGIFNDGNWRR